MSPSRAKETLEAQIAIERKELNRVLDGVRERARAHVNVSQWVRERPSTWLAGALLIGFWLGARR